MKVYYYKDAVGNFGDDLNSWLWDSLLPDFFDQNESVQLSGIGTIINTAMPKANRWVVFSSGVGYGYPPYDFGNHSWDILCVRGPLTAKVLGLSKDKYITDGAALLNTIPDYKPLSESERSGVIFIPHHHALLSGNWEKVCNVAGVEFVNPQWDSKIVIDKIRKAKLVLADAMHAAIIADAMRVPWIPVLTSPQINTFKWLDWTQTITTPYKPIVLGSSGFRESIRSRSLKVYGENYFLKSLDVDDAIADLYLKRKYKSKFLWPYYSKISRKLVYSLPDAVMSKCCKIIPVDFDEKYIDSAASILNGCIQSTHYLSDDKVFYGNLGRLLDCLEKVKKL